MYISTFIFMKRYSCFVNQRWAIFSTSNIINKNHDHEAEYKKQRLQASQLLKTSYILHLVYEKRRNVSIYMKIFISCIFPISILIIWYEDTFLFFWLWIIVFKHYSPVLRDKLYHTQISYFYLVCHHFSISL